MEGDQDLNAMADACIKAAEHVNRSGSSEMQAVMRVLLFLLATETAGRTRTPSEAATRRSDSDDC